MKRQPVEQRLQKVTVEGATSCVPRVFVFAFAALSWEMFAAVHPQLANLLMQAP